jgi:Ribbon-helix-helix protein, copG family
MKEGRPLEVEGKKRGFGASFYVTDDELQELEEIRWRERKSMSALVRIAIDEYIKAHKEGNDTFKLDEWNDDSSFQAVPSILNNWEKWKKYLEECEKDDFFKVLKALTDRRQQAIDIMNKRKLKWEDTKPRYVVDRNATSRYVPMTLGDV